MWSADSISNLIKRDSLPGWRIQWLGLLKMEQYRKEGSIYEAADKGFLAFLSLTCGYWWAVSLKPVLLIVKPPSKVLQVCITPPGVKMQEL